MANQPGVLKGTYASSTKLIKNQYEQESARQYQGHWLDVQAVPKYFQTQDSQATLQGINITHNGQLKLRYLQLYTQAENYQLLER